MKPRTRPLRLPLQAPACYPSQKVWVLYRESALEWAAYRAGSFEVTKFTYCTDCTPEHRDAMVAQGRCQYPGTVFDEREGVIVGMRKL